MSGYHYSAYKFFLITWFIALLSVLVSCSSPKVEKSKRDAKKIYHFPITSIPDDLDPAHPSDIRKDSIINEIFDGLVYLDESYEVQPEIAESWGYDSKTATYTFNLRDDVKFHNGKSVTSEDVKFSFERLLKQRDLPEYCRGALYIKGASDFNKGRAKNIEGIRVIDDWTIEIELNKVYLPFIKILTIPQFSIVYYESSKEDKSHNAVPIGSGPFIFDKKTDTSVSLLANPEYYRGKPKLDGITYHLISDKDYYEDTLDDFNAGKLHHVSIPPRHRDKILNGDFPDSEIISYPVNSIFYFAFNLDNRQFGGSEDKEAKRLIRQAMNYAIDRDYICKEIMGGQAIPFDYVIPTGLLDYKNPLAETMGFKYDLEKAKELLAQSKHPNGKGIKTLKIYFSLDYSDTPDDLNIRIAEEIRKSLSEIGISSEIHPMDDKSLRAFIIDEKPSFYGLQWMMMYPDLDDYLTLFHGGYAREKGKNLSNLTRDYINELIDRTVRTDDSSKVNELFAEIEKEVWYDCPWIFLFQYKNFLLINKNVKGLKDQLCQLDYFEAIPHVRMEEVDLVKPEKNKK